MSSRPHARDGAEPLDGRAKGGQHRGRPFVGLGVASCPALHLIWVLVGLTACSPAPSSPLGTPCVAASRFRFSFWATVGGSSPTPGTQTDTVRQGCGSGSLLGLAAATAYEPGQSTGWLMTNLSRYRLPSRANPHRRAWDSRSWDVHGNCDVDREQRSCDAPSTVTVIVSVSRPVQMSVLYTDLHTNSVFRHQATPRAVLRNSYRDYHVALSWNRKRIQSRLHP